MVGDTTPVVAPMEGSGFYNKNSSFQAAGIEQVMPLWENAVAAVELGAEPLVIADYGSSQGRNSMAPIRRAIAALRARAGSDRPVQVFHTDLPTNDFTSLFAVLYGTPESYLAGASGIFPAAIGRSYFEPILPPGQVHLGWNSWTLQWFSRRTINAPDHIQPILSAVPEVRAAAIAQMAEDWERFLEARAAELRPGGKFLSLFPARVNDAFSWRWLTDLIWESVVEMGRDGLLSAHEQLRITNPSSGRSVGEIQAPFGADGVYAGLTLETVEILEGTDPFWPTFEATGDAEQLGASWANTLRAILGPNISAAIDPARDRKALVDQLFARAAARIAAEPRRSRSHFAVVLLGKPG